MRLFSNFCCVLLICLPVGAVLAQSADELALKTTRVVRTDSPPSIDGRLDELAWSGAAVVEDFHQILPLEYAPPSQRTQFFLLYDDEALYIAGRMWDDDPELITAKVLRQGGQSWMDDQFALILDPFNDKRNGYRFIVNPNGVRQEGLVINTTQAEWNWEGIWQAAAIQDEEGWAVETRIPFKTLSFDPESDTWGVNFTRTIMRNNETIGWVSRNQTQNPAISGVLTGLEEIQQGLGLDVVPSITVNGQRTFAPYSSDSGSKPSLDIFYKITPALNAALTLKTDFSATEVDDRQVNLTRFGLFFPEKRDFFLQDTDIFEFGRLGIRNFRGNFSRPLLENGRPFFSRKIGLSSTGQPVDLDVGGKLSGRIGRWNIGALAVQQDKFEAVKAADLFVGRASANVLQESNVGVIITDGDPRSNLSNSVLGADFHYQNTRLPNGRVIEADIWYQQSNTE
ncbi:MAG: sugar-binding protein, partial [Gammaproteobacteria bacterium]